MKATCARAQFAKVVCKLNYVSASVREKKQRFACFVVYIINVIVNAVLLGKQFSGEKKYTTYLLKIIALKKIAACWFANRLQPEKECI